MPGIDSNTLLMLHMNGTDGSTVFTDSSPYARPITVGGNAQIDTAQSVFGGASGLFDGTGDYLTVADSADFAFGTGNFTMDWWVRFNVVGTAVFYGQDSGADVIYVQYQSSPSAMNLQIYASAALKVALTAPWTPVAGVNYHVALVRNGSVFTFYVNGTSIGSVTDSDAVPNIAAPVYIGMQVTTSKPLNGWMDEYRISNVARWTTSFTPPTAEYAPVVVTPPVVGASEAAYWTDRAALLDPNAYTYVSGSSFNITSTDPLFLLNGWQLNSSSNDSFWYHRKADIGDALLIPPGSPIKHTGSPAGYPNEYGFAYYAKPSLVTGSDSRYSTDPRDFNYSRLERIKTFEVRTIRARIDQGDTRTEAEDAGTNVATFPTDFERGIITHVSIMNACWGLLFQPTAAGVPEVSMNLMDELDDIRPVRFSSSVLLPFKRSQFPKLRAGHGSMYWANCVSSATDPGCTASGANHPSQPIYPRTQTYPSYVELHYVVLPADW